MKEFAATVTNMSRGFSHAVIDTGISYDDDIDAAFEIMRSVAAELRADPAFAGRILDDLEIAGVENLADFAVMLRALQGGAAGAVERAARVPAADQARIRAGRHRDSLSAGADARGEGAE